MQQHEECTDPNPEAHAGEDVDDGWSETIPGDVLEDPEPEDAY